MTGSAIRAPEMGHMNSSGGCGVWVLGGFDDGGDFWRKKMFLHLSLGVVVVVVVVMGSESFCCDCLLVVPLLLS